MAGYVPDHVIQQIVQATDFVRLAGAYCNLKQRGRKYWALCPFHEEKTASFSIDPEKGLYYCFGCKEGGNVFTFLQKVAGLDFVQALDKLARDAGVDLDKYRRRGDGASRGELQKLRELNELATAFYEKCLQKAQGGDKARRYLQARRISEESIESWRLGYAPEGWEHLLKLARGRGIDAGLMEKAGLLVPRTDAPGHYDRFRDRLMFPITDGAGQSIGFGARALSEDDEPKYLNTPESPLFSKGRNFYGLAQAREAIRSRSCAVIVEGYTDVIMCHQFGIGNVMAVLGTSLTEHHARALNRLCEAVVLIFDADEAGEKSSVRSIETLLGQDIEVRLARLPSGQDPCEFLVDSGSDALAEALDASEDFFTYRLKLAAETYDLRTTAGRTAAFRELAQLALSVRDDVRRDILIRRIASEFKISEKSAWGYLEKHWRQGGARQTQETPPAAGVAELTPDRRWAFELTGFLLAHEEFRPKAVEQINTEALPHSSEMTVLERLFESQKSGALGAGEDFVNSLADHELIAIAAKALVQEQNTRVKEMTPDERFQAFMQYCERQTTTTTTEAPTEDADEEALKEYYEKKVERDRRERRRAK